MDVAAVRTDRSMYRFSLISTALSERERALLLAESVRIAITRVGWKQCSVARAYCNWRAGGHNVGMRRVCLPVVDPSGPCRYLESVRRRLFLRCIQFACDITANETSTTPQPSPFQLRLMIDPRALSNYLHVRTLFEPEVRQRRQPPSIRRHCELVPRRSPTFHREIPNTKIKNSPAWHTQSLGRGNLTARKGSCRNSCPPV